MILSHNKDLYVELFTEIARMHDEVDYRKHLNAYHGQKGKRTRYPSVSVGAEIYGIGEVGHHHMYSTQKDFHSLLFKELTNRLGELNDDSINYPACTNKVGHCAENYAASNVLKRIDPNNSFKSVVLRSFQFTKAFRPRTWKNVDWCANCHTMFD